jgi:hypothetical protein
LPSIINRMQQEGQEGALVTGICAGRTNREMVDFNNISCNTVKDFGDLRPGMLALNNLGRRLGRSSLLYKFIS